MCDALFGSGFCDINGYFYPCRSYSGKGIDLKKEIDWTREYGIFNDFLTTLVCTDVQHSPDVEMWCPLNGHTENSLSILAKEKLKTLPQPMYKLNQQIFFHETNQRFFILFSKSNEYVEYTQEGFLIYKLLLKSFSIDRIAIETGCSVEVIWDFLDYECQKKRIVVVPSRV